VLFLLHGRTGCGFGRAFDYQFGLVPRHPGAPNLLVGFFYGCGGFSEAMQKDGGARFIEEIEDAITGLPNP
jgi:hypothetical protein